jgi:prophage regulatory protein
MAKNTGINNQFLKLTAIISLSGKSRSSIYDAIKKGTFPAPVRIGPRAVAWTSTSIAEWQDSCINASKAA